MATSTVIEKFGFERAVSVDTDTNSVSDSQAIILEDIKDFKIDEVYFCEDEQGNSYPAVFIKKITEFNGRTLKEIADAHRQIWNYKKVLFLYVYNDTEIRIYNCAEKPFIVLEKDTDFVAELNKIELDRSKISDKKKLDELINVFSAISIDTGIIWTLEGAQSIRTKINLQRRVDKYLVDSLIRTAQQLEKQGLHIDLIHKIIMRSLFLLYLEDRGATDKNFYAGFKSDATSYFEILEDVNATYALFKKLEERFNGNLFTLSRKETLLNKEQLQLIKDCFISGNDGTVQMKLNFGWRLFNFKIIQIELLSEIYENFLAKTDPVLKQQTATYYTPPSLVELILNEKLPIANGENKCNLKILDPACGSGIFLVESFKRLVKRYENKHKKKLTNFEKLKQLLTDNIFGIELHPQSIKVAAFSLYLALVDKLNPKTIWQEDDKKLPNLINNLNDLSIKEQGKNLFCRDTIGANPEIEKIEFDLVVGNPPFGTKGLLPSIIQYCENQGFAKEMVLPFLHKATGFSPNGDIALIFTTKVLTNTNSTYQKFRYWLFNECYVEKIYNFSILRNSTEEFGGQLFGGATGPISIVFYKKDQPKTPSDKIVYYAPKTFVKSNILEGVSIDGTDVKYLPREECQKPDTKIWKVAMWGSMGDYSLIKKLNSDSFGTISLFARKNKIRSGVGFQLLTQEKDKPKYSEILSDLPYLDAETINRYYTSGDILKNVVESIKRPKTRSFYRKFYNVNDVREIQKLTVFRRLGDEEAYRSPHIVVKKGLENKSVCASKIEVHCSFRDGVYGFYTNSEHVDALNVLMAYFNSRLSTYFLFMTISSYGIEREQIMKNEYLSIPINLQQEQIIHISKIIESILKDIKKSNLLKNQSVATYFDEDIEAIIIKSLGLNNRDLILIDDLINCGLDLFHKKEKSKMLFPVLEIDSYAIMLSQELNDFLEGQYLFANVTTYSIKKFSPLMMVKLSFVKHKKEVTLSDEDVNVALRAIDKNLWEKKSANIYFRKKLNYKDGDDIYLIRPNQRRFWTQTMAMDDASELILEILNEN